MNNMDFSWIIKDINDSLIIKAFYEEKSTSFDVCNYSAKEILSTTGDELVVEESNVSDISNFLNMGIVRFGNSNGGIMDIPLRNIYMLYSNAVDFYKNNDNSDIIDFSSIEGFSVQKIYDLQSFIISNVSSILLEILEIAKNFSVMDNNKKYKALVRVMEINREMVIKNVKNKKF